ncbi:hypothetical protein IU449_25760 [Nocardia higoensis]|uniref:DUF1266 domain-containing protein n=1 Tax=Nocardia higoensis TaxID=228599 RepID=A0ABS0DHG6_9NOCA|nr:hypothetical protein [Nocardia higoensis]MBF6357907.1 hypothetical protein [Nocardia higoensis]
MTAENWIDLGTLIVATGTLLVTIAAVIVAYRSLGAAYRSYRSQRDAANRQQVVQQEIARREQETVHRERERGKLHELELSWFVGDLNRHRLNAERILTSVDPKWTFADLFEKEINGARIINSDEYDSVSAVLRFFYLIDSWRAQGYISEKDAVAVFGRSYVWWYWNHIYKRSGRIEKDPTWHFLVKKHEWLDKGFRDQDPALYDKMRNPPAS